MDGDEVLESIRNCFAIGLNNVKLLIILVADSLDEMHCQSPSVW
jgi:hypothetical protein